MEEETHSAAVSESDKDSIPIPVIRDNSGSGDSVCTAKPLESNSCATNESLPDSEIVQVVHASSESSVEKNENQPELVTHIQTETAPQVQENASSQTPFPVEEQCEQEKVDQAPIEKLVPVPVSEKKKERIGSASNYLQPDRIDRNQSDIFSLKNDTYLTSSIFSVNGAPSRRIYRQRKVSPNNIFPRQNVEHPPCESPAQTPRDKMRDKSSYHEIKRPSSSVRNPLTGTGLISNDEYRFTGHRKKDGNPLLGVGYPETSPSTPRIPPGGFSHKLW